MMNTVDLAITVILIVVSFPLIVAISLIFAGIDRKLHARMQNRIGPPLLQPFYDLIKLFGKERIIPNNAISSIFTIAPIIAVVCSVLGAMIPFLSILLRVNFMGDLILVLYLLAMPSLMIMFGGSSSGNPFGTLGFSRAVVMLMSYEVPMIISIGFVSFKTGFSVTSYDILVAQETAGMPLAFSNLSIAFAAATFIFCIPAAVGVVPFDISEAKTEIVHGTLIEYGGPYLALMKLAKSVLAFSLTFLSTMLFLYFPAYFNGFPDYNTWFNLFVSLLIALLVMFFTVTLPRTLFARLKIGQAFKLYWAIPIILLTLSAVSLIMGL
ncbi:MAG: NADH-quinone oxidoreductase subunit H [Candidatus Bathyarchaeota archaeon]|nr:MAG: NADH-quinone oxidoreductase subunit H [Candidatus Bathyarchaeum tardum]WNZ29009.1 MAG: NADH-quinone oxidoreductase subunit H [Candidatus Bathyarchaeota archaeon]